jgi:beta-aspartyl-dipeptidase (metallo-type)
LAISDHRSSQPTLDEFLRVASDAYVGGLMARKSGVMHVHLGDGPRGLALIKQALDTSELPARLFHPTHVNRRHALFAEAQELAARGVTVDVTAFPADETSYGAPEAIERWIRAGLPLEQITCSSDGAGCLPVFDADGHMTAMEIARPISLFETLAELLRKGYDAAQVLPIFTSNPARVAGLTGKGVVALNGDADLVVLSDDHTIRSVMAGGQWMVRDGETIKLGLFEKRTS